MDLDHDLLIDVHFSFTLVYKNESFLRHFVIRNLGGKGWPINRFCDQGASIDANFLPPPPPSKIASILKSMMVSIWKQWVNLLNEQIKWCVRRGAGWCKLTVTRLTWPYIQVRQGEWDWVHCEGKFSIYKFTSIMCWHFTPSPPSRQLTRLGRKIDLWVTPKTIINITVNQKHIITRADIFLLVQHMNKVYNVRSINYSSVRGRGKKLLFTRTHVRSGVFFLQT